MKRIPVLMVITFLVVACQQARSPDLEIAALIQNLSTEGKRDDALRALNARGERAAPAIPALIQILDSPDVNENSGQLAARVLASIDPTNEEAFRALRRKTLDSRPLVRRTALQGLVRFTRFRKEAVGTALAAMGNLDAVALGAPEVLQALAPPIIPELMQQLDDRSSLALLSAISQRSTKNDLIRQAIAEHEDKLIRVLESSKENVVLNSVSNILYGLDSTKAKEANAALYARRQAFKARVASDRRTRESTPQSLSQINAPIARSQDPIEELRPASALSPLLDDNSLSISVHRAENDDALLEIWRKAGDKYEFLHRVETEGGIQKLKEWETFEFGPDAFLRVPIDIPGSGNFKEEHIFHIELRQRSVQEVRIDRPALSLLPGEYVRKEGGYNFRDNGISYFFYIWTKDGIDEASVDYKIERDSDGTWIMTPGEVKRTHQTNQ